jgi:UDP-N-acetylmuramate dehydrogenase
MNFAQSLDTVSGLECRWDTDLTNFSTFRMRSQGDLVIAKTEEALAVLLKTLKSAARPWRMLGWGANQVLAPQESDLLIQLDFTLDSETLSVVRDEYHLPASVGLNLLTTHAIKFGTKGWEALTGIPASLGGAIFMNAGTALGEIGAVVKRVRLMNCDGHIREEIITPLSFKYRKNTFVQKDEVIIGAVLLHHGLDASLPDKIRNYQEYRRQTQPLATKNCGCVFKNAAPTRQAGRLIDLTGLKGLTVGALRVSHKHANFMENAGGASATDFLEITRLINQQMNLHWGVAFELEVKAV